MTTSSSTAMTTPKWGRIKDALFRFSGRYTRETLFSGRKVCAQGALWIGMGKRRSMLADRRNGATPDLLPKRAVCEVARHYGLSDSIVRRIPSANDDRSYPHNIPMRVLLWLYSRYGWCGIKSALAFRGMIEVSVRSYFWNRFPLDDRKLIDSAEVKTKRLIEKLKRSDAGRFALKAVNFMVNTTTYGSDTGWRRVLRQAYIEMMIPDLVPRYAEEAKSIRALFRLGWTSKRVC